MADQKMLMFAGLPPHCISARKLASEDRAANPVEPMTELPPPTHAPPHAAPSKPPKHPEAIARDEALDTVTANAGPEFRARVSEIVRGMAGEVVLGEDIRLACEAANVRPHHHNAWGGIIRGLVTTGRLTGTGQYESMKAKGSHARKTQIYRINR